MMERLQKVIANYGYCSRRKAEELIKQGKVIVDNKIITTLGYKVDSSSSIIVDGVLLEKENKVYFLLNKPRGTISSASDDKKRTTVVDLIDTNLRIYPVGRLDYDTTGIILLTNDGDFSNMLTSPSNEIEKTYVAKVKGLILSSEIKKLKSGVIIDNYKTSPCKIKIKNYNKKTDTSMVEITIHEGKNHQVKKMFESINHEVLKLKREKIAFLNLSGVPSGSYRNLTPKEVKQLYVLANKKSSSK